MWEGAVGEGQLAGSQVPTEIDQPSQEQLGLHLHHKQGGTSQASTEGQASPKQIDKPLP